MEERLKQLLDKIKKTKEWSAITTADLNEISEWGTKILSLDEWNDEILNALHVALQISNLIYTSSTKGVGLFTDGVYDLLLERYKVYRPDYPIGGEFIKFKDQSNDKKNLTIQDDKSIPPFTFLTEAADMMYYQDLIKNDHDKDFTLSQIPPFYIDFPKSVNIRNVPHNNLELVGTLDKCKFTLTKDAVEAGVADDPSVKIFERDFIRKHVIDGLIRPDEVNTLIAELKYDGVSVVVKVKNGQAIYAYTRGDMENDKTVDLTDFLGGYQFPRAKDIEGEIEIKCEMIIMLPYLNYFREKFNIDYRNARMAAIGIMGRNDAQRFRDYMTLVPLQTDIIDEDTGYHLNRLVEIEFLNKYFAREVNLKSSILSGNYYQLLYMVNRYVDEAQFMRQYFPFLYDGVVISYADDNIRNKLGRQNFVNKFSMAIKFTPLKVQTVFLGYTYTVGKNGIVTPILNYSPVEFYGTVHTKSSGHSYERFKELDLRQGDILEVSYVNDVMPYATKADVSANEENTNPPEEFPQVCPYCSTALIMSPSQKSVICPNFVCPGRVTGRLTSMLSLLGVRDFSEESVIKLMETLHISTLSELFSLTVKDVEFLGPTNSVKLIRELNRLKNTNIYDYEIVGSLGFSNLGKKKWQVILNNVGLDRIIYDSDDLLRQELLSIKGISNSAVDTILEERHYFTDDLVYILNMPNITPFLFKKMGIKIKFSGIRDAELSKYLRSKGFESDDGSVTKDTSILIVPTEDFTSTKTKQAVKYQIPIVTYQDFTQNLDSYLATFESI